MEYPLGPSLPVLFSRNWSSLNNSDPPRYGLYRTSGGALWYLAPGCQQQIIHDLQIAWWSSIDLLFQHIPYQNAVWENLEAKSLNFLMFIKS